MPKETGKRGALGLQGDLMLAFLTLVLGLGLGDSAGGVERPEVRREKVWRELATLKVKLAKARLNLAQLKYEAAQVTTEEAQARLDRLDALIKKAPQSVSMEEYRAAELLRDWYRADEAATRAVVKTAQVELKIKELKLRQLPAPLAPNKGEQPKTLEEAKAILKSAKDCLAAVKLLNEAAKEAHQELQSYLGFLERDRHFLRPPEVYPSAVLERDRARYAESATAELVETAESDLRTAENQVDLLMRRK